MQRIVVDNVSKDFALPHAKSNSLKELIVHPIQALRNRKPETQHALKNIDITVEDGEFFGVVGRNGGGKSTLLKILAGIYQPNKGSVTVNGKLMPFIELGVGFNPELTGRENVFLSGALLGFSQQEMEERYDKIVQFAEIERFMDQKLKNYSSGMQVRLAFSIAIQSEADILLIDEVLAVGDAAFQRKCFSYFKQLKKEKKTVVFVTHSMEAVVEYCDRAMLIDKGKIAVEGTPQEVAHAYNELFVEKDTKTDEVKPTESQYGSNKMLIDSIKTDKSSYVNDDETIDITLKIKSNGAEEAPIVGFEIKNEAGDLLAGTNNRALKVKTKKVEKGKPVEFTYTLQNIFRDGKYLIDIELNSPTGEIYQRHDDILEFEVQSEIWTPHLVQPKISLKQKQLKK